LIFGERHLQRILKDYMAYYNHARPHQGLGQRIPMPLIPTDPIQARGGTIQVSPILGGLHHQYRLAA
jgi:transposase InsO family protein